MNNFGKSPSALKRMSTGMFIVICLFVCSLLGIVQTATVGNCMDLIGLPSENNKKSNKLGCLVFQLLNCSLCFMCILKTFNVL